jgi:hypothetical protein
MIERFAKRWWRRWSETMVEPFAPRDALYYKAMGIDYFVLSPENRLPDARPLFENARYLVYAAR